MYGVPLSDLDDSLYRVKDSKVVDITALQDHKNKQLPHEFQLEEDFDVFSTIESLAVQLIELMATLIEKQNLYVLIRFGLFPLVNCLSHYMLLSKEQVHN